MGAVEPGPPTFTGSASGRAVLQHTVEIARTVFDAYSASILFLDEDTDELVFEAVAHPQEQHLIGMRFPAGAGVAGWVLQSGQCMMVDDLSANPAFSLETARSTGHIPTCMMAAPIVGADGWMGVMEVIDRSDSFRGCLSDVTLLALLAEQASAAMESIVQMHRLGAAAREPAAEVRPAPQRPPQPQ
ncbi:GAF domain-containing protein [Streptacidiphilus albus]|uniref:GAF domain-containing protein n=1 Tax=Streptacidiphilus albus TaxID=105425 RepID=UPI0005A8F61F|nr:GAF domain-containing protein [Streptacidiphilus albus]